MGCGTSKIVVAPDGRRSPMEAWPSGSSITLIIQTDRVIPQAIDLDAMSLTSEESIYSNVTSVVSLVICRSIPRVFNEDTFQSQREGAFLPYVVTHGHSATNIAGNYNGNTINGQGPRMITEGDGNEYHRSNSYSSYDDSLGSTVYLSASPSNIEAQQALTPEPVDLNLGSRHGSLIDDEEPELMAVISNGYPDSRLKMIHGPHTRFSWAPESSRAVTQFSKGVVSRPQTVGYEPDTESLYNKGYEGSTELVVDGEDQSRYPLGPIRERRHANMTSTDSEAEWEARRRRTHKYKHKHEALDEAVVSKSLVDEDNQPRRVPNEMRVKETEQAHRESTTDKANRYRRPGVDQNHTHDRPVSRRSEEDRRHDDAQRNQEHSRGENVESSESLFSYDGVLDVLHSDHQLAAVSARLVSLTLQNVVCDIERFGVEHLPGADSIPSTSTMLVSRAIGDAVIELSETRHSNGSPQCCKTAKINVCDSETVKICEFDLATRLVTRAIENAMERHVSGEAVEEDVDEVDADESKLFVKGTAVVIEDEVLPPPQLAKTAKEPKVNKNIASRSFGGIPRNLYKPAAALRQTQSYKTVKTAPRTNKAKTVVGPKPLTNKKGPIKGQKILQSNNGGKLTAVNKSKNTQVSNASTKKMFKTSNKYKNIKASSSVVAYKKDLQKNKNKLQSKSHGAIGVVKTKNQKKLASKSVGAIPTKKLSNATEIRSKVTGGSKTVKSKISSRPSLQGAVNKQPPKKATQIARKVEKNQVEAIDDIQDAAMAIPSEVIKIDKRVLESKVEIVHTQSSPTVEPDNTKAPWVSTDGVDKSTANKSSDTLPSVETENQRFSLIGEAILFDNGPSESPPANRDTIDGDNISIRSLADAKNQDLFLDADIGDASLHEHGPSEMSLADRDTIDRDNTSKISLAEVENQDLFLDGDIGDASRPEYSLSETPPADCDTIDRDNTCMVSLAEAENQDLILESDIGDASRPEYSLSEMPPADRDTIDKDNTSIISLAEAENQYLFLESDIGDDNTSKISLVDDEKQEFLLNADTDDINRSEESPSETASADRYINDTCHTSMVLLDDAELEELLDADAGDVILPEAGPSITSSIDRNNNCKSSHSTKSFVEFEDQNAFLHADTGDVNLPNGSPSKMFTPDQETNDQESNSLANDSDTRASMASLVETELNCDSCACNNCVYGPLKVTESRAPGEVKNVPHGSKSGNHSSLCGDCPASRNETTCSTVCANSVPSKPHSTRSRLPIRSKSFDTTCSGYKKDLGKNKTRCSNSAPGDAKNNDYKPRSSLTARVRSSSCIPRPIRSKTAGSTKPRCHSVKREPQNQSNQQDITSPSSQSRQPSVVDVSENPSDRSSNSQSSGTLKPRSKSVARETSESKSDEFRQLNAFRSKSEGGSLYPSSFGDVRSHALSPGVCSKGTERVPASASSRRSSVKQLSFRNSESAIENRASSSSTIRDLPSQMSSTSQSTETNGDTGTKLRTNSKSSFNGQLKLRASSLKSDRQVSAPSSPTERASALRKNKGTPTSKSPSITNRARENKRTPTSKSSSITNTSEKQEPTPTPERDMKSSMSCSSRQSSLENDGINTPCSPNGQHKSLPSRHRTSRISNAFSEGEVPNATSPTDVCNLSSSRARTDERESQRSRSVSAAEQVHRSNLSSSGRLSVHKVPVRRQSSISERTMSSTSVKMKSNNSLCSPKEAGRSSESRTSGRVTSTSSMMLNTNKSRQLKSFRSTSATENQTPSSLKNRLSPVTIPATRPSPVSNVTKPIQPRSSASENNNRGSFDQVSPLNRKTVSYSRTQSSSNVRENLSRLSSSSAPKIGSRVSSTSSNSRFTPEQLKTHSQPIVAVKTPRRSSVAKLPPLPSTAPTLTGKSGSRFVSRIPTRTNPSVSSIYNKDKLPASSSLSRGSTDRPHPLPSPPFSRRLSDSEPKSGVTSDSRQDTYDSTANNLKGWKVEDNGDFQILRIASEESFVSMTNSPTETPPPMHALCSIFYPEQPDAAQEVTTTCTPKPTTANKVIAHEDKTSSLKSSSNDEDETQEVTKTLSPESSSDEKAVAQELTKTTTLKPATHDEIVAPVTDEQNSFPLYLPSPPTGSPSGRSSKSSSRHSSPQPGPSGVNPYFSTSPARRIVSPTGAILSTNSRSSRLSVRSCEQDSC